MKIPISEVRRCLPELVRKVQKDAGMSVEITVHGKVVAELRAKLLEPEPGAAARKLRELMRKSPRHRGPKRNVSSRASEHLYGRGGGKR